MTDLLALMNDTRPANRWVGHADRWDGRKMINGTWTNAAYPGLWVKHCGHPTALRPYYTEGIERKFARLADAQVAAIERYQSRSASGRPSSTRPK